MQNLEQVHDYYCAPRDVGDRPQTIYQIWEAGGAYRDSVTPSTFSAEYRSHITLKILSRTTSAAQIVSVGCGNGFVEGDLAQSDRRVWGIDCNDDAVRLTASKGPRADLKDFFDLRPEEMSGVDLIYADGFLGHIFHADMGLMHFFRQVTSFSLRRGCVLVLSNDAPRTEEPVRRHDSVENFWFLSKDFLAGTMTAAGLRLIESYYFPYFRPISGLRNRTISIAEIA